MAGDERRSPRRLVPNLSALITIVAVLFFVLVFIFYFYTARR